MPRRTSNHWQNREAGYAAARSLHDELENEYKQLRPEIAKLRPVLNDVFFSREWEEYQKITGRYTDELQIKDGQITLCSWPAHHFVSLPLGSTLVDILKALHDLIVEHTQNA